MLFDRVTDRLRYLVGLEDTASGQPILGSLPGPVNRGLVVLIAAVAIVGFVSLFRRRTRVALVLAFPALLAGVASALHHYPLTGRTLLFVLPSVALWIGEGLDVLVLVSARMPRSAGALALAIVTLSVAAIAILPAFHLVRPRTNEEMKPALSYLGRYHRHGDVLYVGAGAQYALAYYHLCDCADFDPETVWPFSTVRGNGESVRAIRSRSPNLIVDGNSGASAQTPRT
jgi:hypothetical protein